MRDYRMMPVLAACGCVLLCGCSRTVQTPKVNELFEAVQKGDEAKIIELLDETPGLVNARSGKTRPLHVAARTAYPTSSIPRLLIERGADINDAARFGAMFALFLDQNASKIAAAIAAGEDRDAVVAEALASFRRDASAAWGR